MGWEPRAWLSSGRKTADAAIKASAARLGGVILLGDGTNAATVVLYDNATAATGTALAELVLAANATAPTGQRTAVLMFPVDGVAASNGIFADVTGTGAAYYVYYR